MNKKPIVTIIILVVLLVLALGYIGYIEYSKRTAQQQLSAYQQGAQVGYEQAIKQVISQAATCQQVPLFVGNDTINIIAVECLQKAANPVQQPA